MFRVTDAAILVAATAAGLVASKALCAWLVIDPIENLRQAYTNLDSQAELSEALETLIFVVPPVVAAWSVATIPIRLMGPRPRFRRLARQPGVVASFALVLSLTFTALPWVSLLLRDANPSAIHDGWILVALVSPALAVLASWMALAASGAWRAQPDWVDRFGRVLGAYWILLGLFVLTCFFY
jgi:hypothetical protein